MGHSRSLYVCIKKQLQRTITVLRYLLDLPVQDLTNSNFPLIQISMNIWEFRKWFSLYNILRDYTCFFFFKVGQQKLCLCQDTGILYDVKKTSEHCHLLAGPGVLSLHFGYNLLLQFIIHIIHAPLWHVQKCMQHFDFKKQVVGFSDAAGILESAERLLQTAQSNTLTPAGNNIL